MTIFSLIGWEVYFAGLWRELWAQTWPVIAIVILVGLVIASFFFPVLAFLAPFRKLMLVVAAGLALWFAGQTNGIMLQAAHDKAKAAVILKETDKSVQTSPLGDPRFNDPYDSPDN